MAFDAAQILRQTYAASAEAARFREIAQSSSAAPAASVQRGELMGMAVAVVADPSAELMDSMEELSLQFEEKEAKRAGERKLGEMQGPRTALVKAIESWMAMMPDMPGREFIAKMLHNLRAAASSSQTPDARELLKELARGSTDPSHQFAMLDIMERSLGEGENGLRALVAKAKELLAGERGADIRAGLNLAKEINTRASTPEEMRELRDMYRSEVVGFSKPQECFRSLLSARGAEGLKDAIDFLISGCGADLNSGTPSLEAAALGRILTDLQCVQVLETVLEALTALGVRMDRQFGEKCRMSGEQMTGRVVDLTEQPFVESGGIAAFIAECGMRALLARMDFARELTSLFRKLSPRLFAREGDRQRLVDAAQEHLDDLISEENEHLEEAGAGKEAAS
ncbi:MAG: type III secretion system gatekeeper subunit SctW [Kiritimatiellae bacterium]|nr:type III secretion system gatekeeper subunit SctW [Kiritimatiellia bacterium]